MHLFLVVDRERKKGRERDDGRVWAKDMQVMDTFDIKEDSNP